MVRIRLTVKMRRLTVRIVLGFLIISAVAAERAANLIDCNGARMYTMNRDQIEEAMRDVQEGAARNLDLKGDNPISGDRRIWYSDFNWRNWAQAYDHCSKACLLPALSYGFDAAFCRLGTFHDHWQVSVGYTPAAYFCHVDGTALDVLPDICAFTKKIPMPDDVLSILLQDYDMGVADIKDVWTATKHAPKGIVWTKWTDKEPQREKLLPLVNDDYRYVGVTWGGFWELLKKAFEKMWKMFPNTSVICVGKEKCAKKGSA